MVQRLTAEFGIEFSDAFCQTEASYLVAHGRSIPGELPSGRKTWCPQIEMRLVDDAGRRVRPGTPGQCLVRGPSLMSGYLDDPAATEEVFADGWLHTGDVLVENEDATYTYVDRAKYLIKSGGENVFPAEVEQVLTLHPEVVEACAFGVPDPRWGEVVKVVVVVAPGATATKEDLARWSRDRIASFKRPRYVEFMAAESLPRSTTGKLQRHLLAAAGARPEEQV
ncbi:class I adenylate-forming enzyme family protein [Gordonia asplenii]|uniref:class I adenylate-forming enzyme family protein n=1 Tax=Gordonia asplenii TaxID=2725283 RepID=UPI0028A818CD|nr:fatty acid--CoA ligase family protein [Gordonia asplenii]